MTGSSALSGPTQETPCGQFRPSAIYAKIMRLQQRPQRGSGGGQWVAPSGGGQGTHVAVDRRTGGVLAVKFVAADRAGELRRERGILRGLNSPHVVRCLDAEDRSGGGLNMLMEYAPGGSLADEIRRCGGRCAEALVRSRARDILLGLAHVHAAGVAHCDVKGRNVLVASPTAAP
nr:mitogen-activated protein kinase kinase kinase 17-like [Aegilops tauschii subsp. strangulata]